MQNQTINNVNTDNAIADILDELSFDYIYHIINDSLSMKFRPYSGSMPNIPYSLEQNFKIQLDAAPSSRDAILQKREEVNKTIIDILCNYYNLGYNGSDDIYSDAFYMYKFLVSDFTNTVVQFFVNYIIKEKKHIYENINLQETKKNKDSSYSYSKKLYSNNVIAAIHANIVPVVQDIAQYDITLQDVLDFRYMGDEQNTALHLSKILIDNGVFYNYIREIVLNDATMPDAVNCIKLQLQAATGDIIRLQTI
jgi:hypothetical protein